MSENFESTYEDSLNKIRESVAKAPFYPADHPSQAFWQEDGVSLTGNPHASPDMLVIGSRLPGGLGDDHISFNYPSTFNVTVPNDTNKNGFWKYEEDKTLKEVEQYLSSTYHSHYTSETSKTQTLDLIESIGDAEAFTRSNAIKYLSRFGKKNGKSKQDILKAIHYCVLLYHFAGLHKNTTNTYNY